MVRVRQRAMHGFWLLLLLLLLLSTGAHAQSIAVPELKVRVTDLSGTLDPGAQAALESKLDAFEKAKGSQVAVLIVPSTKPETIEQYAIRVVDAWKLGRAEQDDGVLLLVAKNDRSLRIEVGKGLEGAIPDALAKRIIAETIVPEFRNNHFAGGIDAGIDQILGLIRGEALPPPVASGRRVDSGLQIAAAPLMLTLLMIGTVFRRMFGALGGASLTGVLAFVLGFFVFGVVAGALAAGVMFVIVLMLGGRGGGGGFATGAGMGYGGGFGSMGGGGGFSSGGGFSGGGGGFSGGGASGSW